MSDDSTSQLDTPKQPPTTIPTDHSLYPEHNLFLTETFVFGVFVACLAVIAPVALAGGWLTKAENAVSKASDAVETLVSTAAGAGGVPSAAERPIPHLRRLPNVLPHIIGLLMYAKPLFIDFPYYLLSWVLTICAMPITLLYYILNQLLAPVIILAQVVFDVFIRTPWNALTWVLALLYPVYVFCGIAALVGAVCGLAGAGVGRLGLWLTMRNDLSDDGGIGEPVATDKRSLKGKKKEVRIDESGTGRPRGMRRKVEFAA
ncbi:hypothetical protein FRB99_005490 [Tulasnella sp. 403]|nr:hypothetical protein FRB99_005490 [Tulasnella sp. 403]